MMKGGDRGLDHAVPIWDANILFVESPMDSSRLFANKPRLVAPFYDGYIYP